MPNANTDKNILAVISAVILMVLLSSALSSRAHAGDGGGGAAASAATLGRGTVSAAGAMDATDIYRFTANSGMAGEALLAAGLTEQGGGAKNVYGAAALPVFYSGAFGVFAQQSAARLGYSAPSNTFGLSLARYDSEFWYGIGGHIAFTESRVLDENEYSASFGFDFRVDPYDAFTGRAYFLNSGLPLRKGSGRRLSNQFGLIVNYHPLREISEFWDIDFGAGAQKTDEDAFVLGASAELCLDKRYFARIGYENPVNAKMAFAGLSAGAGILIGGFGADGAYRFGKNGAGGVWGAGVKYHIESLKKRRPADNFALARKHYGKENYKKSLRYAKRTLAADSAHWNAKTLIRDSETEIRRQSGGGIAIIYGGNARGTAVPFPPSPEALGSLSRYAAAVSALREANPVNFTIDVGNMVNAQNDELKIELAASYYDLMNYDAVAPGEGEIAMGPFEFMAAQKRKLPVVITNLNDNDAARSGISSSILLTNDGYGIYIINLVAQSVLGGGGKPNMTINMGGVKSQLNGPNAAGANLRVAVIHGSLEDIKRLAGELPEIDIIIAGSLDQKLEKPLTAGRALILSAGSGNKYAGCVTLNYDDRKTRRGRFIAENKLYPVYQSITPDPAIERAAGLVSTRVEVIESREKDVAPVRVSGIIPHLSDRGGGRQAFIKAVENKGDYPLGGDGIVNSRRPVFSPQSNRAAFIFGGDTEGSLRMVDLSAMNGRTVSSGRNVMEAAFSPGDGFLYYIEAERGGNNGAIYKTRMYMFDAITVLESDSLARRDLSISDDGATILFCAKSDGRWHIYALDSSAMSAPVRLTGGNADHRYPRLSPDGKHVAYLTDRKGFGGQMDLWIFERGKNGAAHRQITTKTNVRDFCWDADSETIYFSAGANVYEINSVNIHRPSISRLIPHNAKAWSENTPRFIISNSAPKVVYTREYPNGAKRIHWYNIISREDVKLYAVGDYDEWID